MSDTFTIPSEDGGTQTITTSRVRSAIFISQARDVFSTIYTLVKNGTHDFETRSRGAIIVTGSYLNWEFIAPNNWYDPSETYLVSELLMGLYTQSLNNPVPAWDEFAIWLSREKRATFNALIGEGRRITIRTNTSSFNGESKELIELTGFAPMIQWLISMCPHEFLDDYVSDITVAEKRYVLRFVFGGTTLTMTFRL